MINTIESLLNMDNPSTKRNWMSYDKGDCSKVGIIRILMIQTIEDEINERGVWYDGCYNTLLDSLYNNYNT